jgi:hypothetical protein
MSPISWIRYGFEFARGLLDLAKAAREIKAPEPAERTNPEKIREQAAGASAHSESQRAGRVAGRVARKVQEKP